MTSLHLMIQCKNQNKHKDGLDLKQALKSILRMWAIYICRKYRYPVGCIDFLCL